LNPSGNSFIVPPSGAIAGRYLLDPSAPADVYFGRGQTILLERERTKRDTIKQRRLQHHSKAA
jgi:hypothetical protein